MGITAFTCKRCSSGINTVTYQDPDGIVCLSCASEIRQEIKHNVTLNTGLPCHPSETAVVFRDQSGNYRFPCRNNAPTPEGHERVELRTIRELRHLEHETGKRSEVLEYDRGSGRSFPTGHPDHPLY